MPTVIPAQVVVVEASPPAHMAQARAVLVSVAATSREAPKARPVPGVQVVPLGQRARAGGLIKAPELRQVPWAENIRPRRGRIRVVSSVASPDRGARADLAVQPGKVDRLNKEGAVLANLLEPVANLAKVPGQVDLLRKVMTGSHAVLPLMSRDLVLPSRLAVDASSKLT